MITRTKKNLMAARNKGKKEAERAVRWFFGTFAHDIKRNWVDETLKIKRKTHHHVSQLTNPI